MKLNFQQKLVFNFLVIFTAFTVLLVVFEQRQARGQKTEALCERLDTYTDGVFRYLNRYGSRASMDSIRYLMPADLRLTLIDRSGKVIYDNAVAVPASMENHAGRPEIADAIETGSGTFIRTSASNSQPYLYYAKDNGGSIIVRVALPYDIKVQSFLKPDNAFLYFVIALFIAGIVLIYYVSRHFGRSVRHLRDFSQSLKNSRGNEVPIPDFPKDEFGEIGKQLAEDFNKSKEGQKQLAQERERLLLHIQTSAEGVCFFNPDRSIAFYNGLFLQYFNLLAGDTEEAKQGMFDNMLFNPVSGFLDNPGEDNYYETRISHQGRKFMLRLNIFQDRSFEIILTDITAGEKTRRLKQEMTGNIAHELRTPVTSIRGFLEIILNNELGKEKSREYLERAYSQTKTLSELIADMGLLTRIDKKNDASLGLTQVDIKQLIERVHTDTAAALKEKGITFSSHIPDGLMVNGNVGLLYSVFRNLTDNVIRHAGEGVDIDIKITGMKDGMAYFSFADTGKGIRDEHHLNYIFERFYRVNEGRSRDTGGSGLGLSIVKNAVQFHGGTITVRNRQDKGLEFLFTLPYVK